MSQHTYDYAVIGGGLTGLAVATRLSRETPDVALIESTESLGGVNRPVNFPTGLMNNGLRSLPATPLTQSALLFLESLLGLKLIQGEDEIPAVTYEAGGLREFVGFGEQSPDFYDLIAPMTAARRLNWSLEPSTWPSLLQEKFAGTILPLSHVTRFHFEGEAVTHVTVNGAKTLKARNFIYAGPVRSLATLLPPEAMSARTKQKLAKNLYWTALCLDLCHGQVQTESSALHILNGTTQDEIGPCVGRFLPAVEIEGKLLQSSQWLTFLDEEVTEDSELVAGALKKIKRQLKRAYPQALEGLLRERIMVAPSVGGTGELKLNSDQTFGELKNLWIASAALSPAPLIANSLLQAQLVLASMGFEPKLKQSHDSLAGDEFTAEAP